MWQGEGRERATTSPTSPTDVMIAISNEDFRTVRMLLGELQRLEGVHTRTKEVKRKAKRLRKKLDRKNNQL